MQRGNPPRSKGHGIFFLLAGSGGSWSLLPVISGQVELPGTYIAAPSSVPQEIRANAAANLSAGAATDLDRMIMEILVTTEAQGRSPGRDLVWLFRADQSPTVAAALARFPSLAQGQPASDRTDGASNRQRSGGDRGPAQEHASLSPVPEWRQLVEQIKYYYANSSAAAAQSLGETTTDLDVPLELRMATAAALARVHTRQSLPYLARLLDAPNPRLVAAAVGGLSGFANNVPIASQEPAAGEWEYRTDETISHSSFDESAIAGRGSHYVGFWKTWWLSNQAKLAH